jgi:DNA-binding NarL/FixJ family response regulator
MSYDGERENMRQAMAAGAREYLIKPFNGDEFVNAVRRVAARVQEPLVAQTPEATEAALAREQALINVAVAYLREARTDNDAARVYAQLVQLPQLDSGTLTRLAEFFLARRDWSTLRLICERLERAPRPAPAK